MKRTIKKILIKLKFLDTKSTRVSDKITFPGGIVPINETKPEDVFIVGFPKSGNTLMQHIITHLVYGINEEGSRSMVNLIVPDIYANSHYFRFNTICYFKSHERPQPAYKKVIYLLRDGREALLSYYHMMKNMGKDISLEELYEGKINIYGGLWHEHIEAWEKNPYEATILWVKYEDLKNDKYNQLKRICEFLNIKRTPQDLEKVVELTSLEHMKTLENRSDWQLINKSYFIENKKFLRKGSVDSFKKNIPAELIKEFTSQNLSILKKYYSK